MWKTMYICIVGIDEPVTSSLEKLMPLTLQVVYQKILKLAYVDKLLDQVHLVFRDRYKNEVVGGAYGHQFDFSQEFKVQTAV